MVEIEVKADEFFPQVTEIEIVKRYSDLGMYPEVRIHRILLESQTTNIRNDITIDDLEGLGIIFHIRQRVVVEVDGRSIVLEDKVVSKEEVE